MHAHRYTHRHMWDPREAYSMRNVMAILQAQIYKQICCNKALAWGLDSFSSGSDFYLSVALGKLVSLFSFIFLNCAIGIWQCNP